MAVDFDISQLKIAGREMIQAVTLSGGGAYGAYEVGVLKALMGGHAPVTGHTPLDPTIFTGTSAGAYIAAVLLSSEACDPQGRIDHLERIWFDQVCDSPSRDGNGIYHIRGDVRRYLEPAWLARNPIGPIQQVVEDAGFFASDMFVRTAAFATSHEPMERRALEMLDLSALISTDPFHELVKRTIDIERIRQSKCAIRIAATNWKTGQIVLFKNSNITHDAILASAAIPGVFPPVQVRGQPHVDGGILMNTPLKPAIDNCADIIHIVALDPNIANVPPSTLPNTLDTFERLLNISNSSRIEADLKLAKAGNKNLHSNPDHRHITIHVYRPSADMGGVFGMLNFQRSRIQKLVDEGFEDAVKHNCHRNGCVV
jgi:predicted acylesterase/phospholipase RssA